MSCAVEFEKFNQATGKNEKYLKLDEKKQDLLDRQLSQASTKKQKEVSDTLVRHHSQFEGVNQENYVNFLGKRFKRVTKFIQDLRDGYYVFDGDNSDYDSNRNWGNVVDTVFEGIILNKPIADIYKDVALLGTEFSIETGAIETIKEQIDSIKKLHPGSVFLPQLTLSSSLGVAGTLDLTVIDPSGKVHIYDLKSSTKPITKPSEKTDAFGNTFTTRYEKTFTVKDGRRKASKKQSHEAQLNFYKGMVKEIIGKDSVETIGIIPAVLTIDEFSNVSSIAFEGLFEHSDDNSIQEGLEKNYTREEFINSVTDLTNTEFLAEVVEALETEVKLLREQGKYYSIPKIESIIENIQVGEGMTKISEFIEYMYEEFVTDNKSLKNRFNDYLNSLDINETDVTETLQELDAFKSEIELFRGIVEELQDIHDELQDISKTEAESNKEKLEKIVSQFHNVERVADKKIIPLLAKILAKELPDSKEYRDSLTNKIQSLKKRLNQRMMSAKRRREIEEEIKKVQMKLNESDATIEEALRTGNYEDISVLSSQLNPAVSVDNTIIATFAKTLKTAFEKARLKLFNLEKVAAKAFDEYAKVAGVSRNNVKEFNKPFYEVIGQGEDAYYALVQKLDYNSFRKAMDEVYKQASDQAKSLKDKGEYGTYSLPSLTKKLARDIAIKKGYYKKREAKDQTIKNPYTGEVVTISYGYETVIKKHKETHSEENHKKWLHRNFSHDSSGNLKVIGNELYLPNDELFVNEKYQALQQNKAALKYYQFLTSTYIKAQSTIGDGRMMNKLPGIEKVANDRIREGDVKGWFGRYIEGITDYLPNEQEEYGAEDVKYKRELKKKIPHLYQNNIGLENTSLDLIGSILTYAGAAERHAAQTEMEPIAKSLLNTVSKKGPLHSHDTPISKLLVGNKVLGEYSRKHKGNNTAAMLEALIDMHIYGQSRIKAPGKWNKIVDGLMGFASFTQIGGNPVLGVANSLAAHISTNIDSMASEHFKTKTWLWAKAEYRKNELNFWNDMLGTTKKSKIGQLTQLYDALQGEYMDEFGRKMSQGKIKKIWGSKAWFGFMHKGEHAAQTKVMMALLKDTMVKDKDGKDISLYDAYYVDSTGKLNLKSGVQSEFLNAQVRNKLHSLNKRFNGVYNSFDKPLIKRHNIGKLVMMYRDFLAPNIRRRFKSWGVDYESGTEYEGYYNTFFRILAQERGEMLALITGKDNNLTSHEIANVKRMATEITYMMLLSSIIAILSGALEGDDDEDAIGMQSALKYALYWSMRASSELSFYNFGLGSINTALLPLNPGGTLRSFRTPSPAYSILEKSFRAVRHTGALIGGSDEAYYKRNMEYDTIFGNLAEKGDPKATVSWMKLMGLNGYLMNIDNAIKILNIYD